MPRVRFPFLSKSFAERDKSRQAGGPPEEGDRDREEEKRGKEHLRGQTAISRLQWGHLICQSEVRLRYPQDVCAQARKNKCKLY